jgi:mannose-6-phosphate isomerase-like protein (cupin superfamily)
MYVVLAPDALDRPETYPEWCDLGWFRNYRHLTGAVETHYHDLPEIYLWHEGNGDARIDGQPVTMRSGVMVYTAAGAQHSITPAGVHSNTGIMPKAFLGCRHGHLHTQETGESPKPKAPSFRLTPEENPFATPRDLPRHCFTRRVACGRFADAQTILQRTSESWLALLVREGRINVRADGHVVDVPESHLFIASQGVDLRVSSVGNSEVALAEGWPAGTSR